MSQDTLNTMNDQKNNMFAQRLKSAREAMHLDTKDVAAQLRLNERIILMLESGTYDDELPVTFLRGYIRAYGKLLQLPEDEIQAAIEPLQPKKPHIDPALLPPKEGEITTKNYTMKLASTVIGLSMIGLIGTWWHNHSTQTNHSLAPMNLPQPMAEAAPIPAIAPAAPLPSVNTINPDSSAHPLANAMAQQISPPAATIPPTTTAPAEENKPAATDNIEAPKPAAAPTRKAAPAKANDESDDDDDDNVDDNSDTD